MTIVKWRNRNPYTDLANSIEKMFYDGFVRRVDDTPVSAWTPDVDVIEEEGAYVVKADIPGIAKEDVHVEVENGMLTIRGEKKEEKEEKGKTFYRQERVYGSFSRSFHLPETADVDAIKAVHKDGLLELTIPKKEETKPKKIDISVN